jgi:integrase
MTKFGKSRLVPLHATTCEALRRYADRRDTHLGSRCGSTFFVTKQGSRLLRQYVYRVFWRLPRQIANKCSHAFTQIVERWSARLLGRERLERAVLVAHLLDARLGRRQSCLSVAISNTAAAARSTIIASISRGRDRAAPVGDDAQRGVFASACP